jgi:multidrug resistance efflux pump
MSEAHVPNPAFVRTLECEIRGAVRRQATFGPGVARRRWSRVVGLTALIAAALLGASGVVVAQELRHKRQRMLLVLKAEVRAELATVHAEQARRRAGEVETQHKAAIATEADLAEARQAAAEAEASLARRRLDVEEMRRTGRPPLRSLSAPRVGGRDFVAEGLRIDLELARTKAKTLGQARDRVRLLWNRGFVSEEERAAVERDAETARVEVDRLEKHLKLRQAFHAGKVPAEKVDLLAMRSSLESAGNSGDVILKEARARVTRLEALHRAGVVTSDDLRKAKTDVARLEAEARLVALELELVRTRIGD